jgi:hypothetical protein
MKRLAHAALLVVGPLLLLLVYAGLLDLSRAIWLGVALDIGFTLLATGTALALVRRTRLERRAGLDGWEALDRGLAGVLPPPASTLLRAELRLLSAALRWVKRDAPPPSRIEPAESAGSR